MIILKRADFPGKRRGYFDSVPERLPRSRTLSFFSSASVKSMAKLDHVGGYREDPLRKKSALLAMILNNRPEKYF